METMKTRMSNPVSSYVGNSRKSRFTVHTLFVCMHSIVVVRRRLFNWFGRGCGVILRDPRLRFLGFRGIVPLPLFQVETVPNGLPSVTLDLVCHTSVLLQVQAHFLCFIGDSELASQLGGFL